MTTNGAPKYTRWEQVPDGLFTKTQLGKMDPPLKPAPSATVRGRVLYHGNMYADLYGTDDAVPKRATTPAQRAALEPATALRYVCKHCDRTYRKPLGLGRRCEICESAERYKARHDSQSRHAAELIDRLAGSRSVAVAVDSPRRPRHVAVIDLALPDGVSCDGPVLLELTLADPESDRPQPGTVTYAKALAELNRVLAGTAQLVWEYSSVATAFETMLHPELADAGYDHDVYEARQVGMGDFPAVFAPSGGTRHEVRHLYTWWYAEPDQPECARPDRFHPTCDLPVPGATADPVADARSTAATLLAIANGTASVSPRAPWLTWPPSSLRARGELR